MDELNWNKERWRTRDLLLDQLPFYSLPSCPQLCPSTVYPWEEASLSRLNHQLYLLALKNGFGGTENEFTDLFFSYISNRDIVFARYVDFPAEGSTYKLYFDLDEKVIYYYSAQTQTYIPANALLIEHTLLQGGEA